MNRYSAKNNAAQLGAATLKQKRGLFLSRFINEPEDHITDALIAVLCSLLFKPCHLLRGISRLKTHGTPLRGATHLRRSPLEFRPIISCLFTIFQWFLLDFSSSALIHLTFLLYTYLVYMSSLFRTNIQIVEKLV